MSGTCCSEWKEQICQSWMGQWNQLECEGLNSSQQRPRLVRPQGPLDRVRRREEHEQRHHGYADQEGRIDQAQAL